MLSRKQRQLKEVHLEISIRMAGWQDGRMAGCFFQTFDVNLWHVKIVKMRCVWKWYWIVRSMFMGFVHGIYGIFAGEKW